MDSQGTLQLEPFSHADIPALTRLMQAAFDADQPTQGTFDAQCLECYHCADLLERWPGGCLDADGYKVLVDEQLIGGAVVWHFSEQRHVLGLLFIDPAYQHSGAGSTVWRMLEARYPETAGWQVATPAWSARSLRFYTAQCGFYQVGQQGAYVVFAKDGLHCHQGASEPLLVERGETLVADGLLHVGHEGEQEGDVMQAY